MTITKSGELASFYTVNKAPIKHLKVYFSPKQAGEGEPSPDNVREIEGWDGIRLKQTGKNLINTNDFVTYRVGYSENFWGIKDWNTATHPDGSLFLPAGNYTVSIVNSINRVPEWRVKNKDNEFLAHQYGNLKSIHFNNPENQSLILYINSQDIANNIADIQLEIGSSKTAYVPYSGHTYNLDWSSTLGIIYGGYVDLVTGELVQTHKNQIYDGSSDESWALSGTNTYVLIQSDAKNDERNIRPLCDKFLMEQTYTAAYTVRPINNNLYANSVSEWRTWLSENPIQVVYQLTTPITHQLTSTQLFTLIGQNNIWSNADRVEVEYDLAESNDELYRRRNIILSGYPCIETASGDIASFQTDMVAPLKEAKIYFNPSQEGEGDPSPENIRPISGWTGFNILQTNKNLYGGLALANYFVVKGATLDTNAKIISYSGSTANSIGTLLDKFDSGQYTIIAKFTSTNNNQNLNIRVYYTDGGELLLSGSNAVDTSNGTYKFLTNASKTIDRIACSWIAGTCTLYYENFGIFKGNIDISEFIPCTNDIISLNWEDEVGTVYGGYVDLISGNFIKTHLLVTLTGDETIAYNDWNNSGFSIHWYNDAAHGWISNTLTNMKCNMLNIQNYGFFNTKNGYIRTVGSSAAASHCYVLWKQDDIFGTTVEECKAKLKELYANNTPLQFVIETQVDRYTHYSLSPQILKTLKGTNNIWSNANGPIEVKYWTH